MTYLLCAYRDWALQLYTMLAKRYKNMFLLKDPKKLTFDYVKKINPKFVFFPDWSWKVDENIVKNFKCVCIHESNLPKFRGGSPLQNQIIRGIKKTKSTAFLMTEKLDEGDILLQKDLSLEGSIDDIFARMKKNDYDIITKIIAGKYRLKKQKGRPTYYKRRQPQESELKTLNHSKRYLYDFIRMLGDPYPNAFIKIGKKRIIFKSANFDGNELRFEGVIE
jgi:methionyl-tRNA formyltransferase